MKVFVTGGSGRIGQKVLEELETTGYDVINYDLIEPPTKKYTFIKGSITDLMSLNEAIKGVDAVVHLAAFPTEGSIPNYPKGWEVNVTGTFYTLEASIANNVKKYVYASSICATGLITWVTPYHSIQYFPVDEKHPCKPQDLYGTGKLIGEKLCYMYSMRSALSAICLRIATVWFDAPDGGPSEATKNLIKQYVVNPELCLKMPPRFKDLPWQYVGVWDVAQAIRLALEKDVKFDIYNIGGDESSSELDSEKIVRVFYPGVPLRNYQIFKAYPKWPLFDISKACRKLGYRPKFNWRQYYEIVKREL